MPVSTDQAAVPAFLQTLEALSATLAKAETFADARRIDPEVLPAGGSPPTCSPSPAGFQIATDHAKGCCARIAKTLDSSLDPGLTSVN